MKKKAPQLLLILALFSILFIVSCKKDDEPGPLEVMQTISKEEVLEQTIANVILPSIAAFATESSILVDITMVFKNNPNSANLEKLQNEWNIFVLKWRECEAYNLGKIKQTYLYERIHSWPVNPDFIEFNIQSMDSINENYIKSKGSSSKGFAGIEYLIYQEGNNFAVLDSFINSTFSSRRMDYLMASTLVLEENAKTLEQEWNSYQNEFVSNKGSGINSTFNQLINELITVNERVLQRKLGKPSGITNSQNADSTLLEAYRSGKSLGTIQSNIQSLESCVFSNNTLSSSSSVANYINFISGNEILTNRLQSQFAKTKAALDALNKPLKNTIYTEQTKTMIAYGEIKNLLVLLKVDVASQLSITLTINDNDGD